MGLSKCGLLASPRGEAGLELAGQVQLLAACQGRVKGESDYASLRVWSMATGMDEAHRLDRAWACSALGTAQC